MSTNTDRLDDLEARELDDYLRSQGKKCLGPGDDAFMVDHPDCWPQWPILPIKRGDIFESEDNTGVLLECPHYTSGKRVVYHCNLFALPTSLKELKGIKKTEYPDTAALLAAGWIVD
jgi:hypothetical protein